MTGESSPEKQPAEPIEESASASRAPEATPTSDGFDAPTFGSGEPTVRLPRPHNLLEPQLGSPTEAPPPLMNLNSEPESAMPADAERPEETPAEPAAEASAAEPPGDEAAGPEEGEGTAQADAPEEESGARSEEAGGDEDEFRDEAGAEAGVEAGDELGDDGGVEMEPSAGEEYEASEDGVASEDGGEAGELRGEGGARPGADGLRPRRRPTEARIPADARRPRPGRPPRPGSERRKSAVRVEMPPALIQTMQSFAQRIDKLESNTQKIARALVEIVKEGDNRKRAYDVLYGEMRQYKENFIWQAQKPMFMDLITLFDSVLRAERQYEEREGMDEVAADFRYLKEELLETLYRYDVELIEDHPERLDIAFQKPIKRVDSDDPEDDRRVVQYVREGFIRDNVVLRPQEIVVKRYSGAKE